MQRHEQLTARGHVHAQVLLVGHAQQRLGPEGLAGIDHLGPRIVGAEGLHVAAHGVAEQRGVVDHERRAELGGKGDHVAPADGQVPLGGRRRGRREDL